MKRIHVINIITLLISTLLTSTAAVYAGTLNEVSLITRPDENMLQRRELDIEELFERHHEEVAEEEIFEAQEDAPEPEKILEEPKEAPEQEILEAQEEAPEQEILEAQEEVPEPEKILEKQEQADDTSTAEEYPETIDEVLETADFDGETVEVATMAQFIAAVANPEVAIISVQANLSQTSASIMAVDRPLLIQGNGFTLTFGNNGLNFQLVEVEEASTLRIENAVITKVGTTPLINANVDISRDWTVELEDVQEVNANTMRLLSLPEGRVAFTGGINTFTRTSSAQVFIVAKEILVTNQATVTINRGNAIVFSSAATVASPKLTVQDGSTMAITTASGVANTINFEGTHPEIQIQSGSRLEVSTVGTTAAPTDIRNNAIALTGAEPKLLVHADSSLSVTTTLAKRGIHLSGENPVVSIKDSTVSITSATQGALNLVGTSPRLIVESSVLALIITTGQAINLNGETPSFIVDDSEIDIQSTTGQRINLVGDEPSLRLKESQLAMGQPLDEASFYKESTQKSR